MLRCVKIYGLSWIRVQGLGCKDSMLTCVMYSCLYWYIAPSDQNAEDLRSIWLHRRYRLRSMAGRLRVRSWDTRILYVSIWDRDDLNWDDWLILSWGFGQKKDGALAPSYLYVICYWICFIDIMTMPVPCCFISWALASFLVLAITAVRLRLDDGSQ